MIVRILKLFTLFAVFTVVVGASAYLTFSLLVKGADTVVVPDLEGRDVVYCLETLTNLGLNIKVKETLYDNRVPKHHVLYQHPKPGEEIKKGRDVQIIISRGCQQIFMPDLRQVPLEQARIIIEENDLQPGAFTKTYRRNYKKNTVIAQVPVAGQTVNKGDNVDLLVSLGQRPQAYIMPDLVKLPLSSAFVQIEELGLQPGEISSAVSGDQPNNTVISQDPLPGGRVVKGTRVNLTINRDNARHPSLMLRGAGGVRLFRYRLEKGILNRHIKVTINYSGFSFDLYDQYLKPDTEVWVLIPAHRDVTLLLYEDNQLVDTFIFSGWEQ